MTGVVRAIQGLAQRVGLAALLNMYEVIQNSTTPRYHVRMTFYNQAIPFPGSANSTSQPIPILPPPPAPMSQGPSRARRQLAARLAAQKQQTNDGSEGAEDRSLGSEHETSESQWPTNPFVIAGLDEDTEGNHSPADAAFPSNDFPPTGDKDEPFSSPTFPESGFSPPDSFSTGSSDDDGEGRTEGMRRKERVPLEVEDDDDDMGEMVGPSADPRMMDSDEEDEAIMNESLGYPDLGPGRYMDFARSRMGASPFGEDNDNDSSDGEDDGLVEILVPGRKSSTSSMH
ncbi:hypothetical protein BP00DRAFT_42967 [Aspergillus indologenus CBS 114.80]|uniref:Uncharacterized protein n=1 Tax=Aspergillus indologenus CBS 114.80 TaxID=1450541 RepID=A0A2V5ID58_9EURO|nr:hypothetical protein BP00DRAFT_42967 [Aspergillus indologenus CBS 114.80]